MDQIFSGALRPFLCSCSTKRLKDSRPQPQEYFLGNNISQAIKSCNCLCSQTQHIKDMKGRKHFFCLIPTKLPKIRAQAKFRALEGLLNFGMCMTNLSHLKIRNDCGMYLLLLLSVCRGRYEILKSQPIALSCQNCCSGRTRGWKLPSP